LVDIKFLYENPICKRFALKLTKDINSAEDLIQDVALKLLEHSEYTDKSAGDLLKISLAMIRNKFIDDKRVKRNTVELDGWEKVGKPEIIEKITNREEINHINKKLSKFHPTHREIFILVAEGYSYSEIIKIYPKPYNTLVSQIFNIRKYLFGKKYKMRKLRKVVNAIKKNKNNKK
jgi:RNA polymerase sigma factor (sigma-70 family)